MNIPPEILTAIIGAIGTVVGVLVVWIGKALMNRSDNATRLVEQVLMQQGKTNAAVIDPHADRSPGGTPAKNIAQQVSLICEQVGANGETLADQSERIDNLDTRVSAIEAELHNP